MIHPPQRSSQLSRFVWLLVIVGLTTAVLFAVYDLSAAQQPAPPIDPEPPVDYYLPEHLQTDAPNALQNQGIIELGWQASVNDFTNALAWGDYDADGDLDLLTANVGDNIVYENLGGGVLTETTRLVCTTELPDNTYGSSWADYDRDGDLDIVLGNFDGRNCVYRYDAGEGFTQTWIADTTQNTRDVAWAGWEIGTEYLPYFAVANADEPNAVYRFEAGNFDLWWTDFQDATTNAVAWGDYDNDGDPDLAIGNFGQENFIYRNDNTTLTAVFSTTSTAYTRDVVWGDFDNDGDLDLAVGNGRTTGLIDQDEIYCNSGAPAYNMTLCWTSQEQYPTYAVDFGDYDGDGDLDLVASSESDGFTRVYVNESGSLQTFASWSANDEAATSRDVVWADWDGDGDMELSVAYFSGSQPNVIYNNVNGNLETSSFGPDVSDTRSIAWGDYDGDLDLDLVVGNSSAAPNIVYENVNGVMTPVFSTTETFNTRSVAWGDFNGDNLLDFTAVNGQNAGGQENQVYCNLGDDTFAVCASFGEGFLGSPANSYSAAWGDFDGDQDLDLAVGNYETNQRNRIYINGGGVFTQVLNFGAASDQTLSVAWADYDQDFDLDLVVGNATGENKLYINDEGTFGTSVVTLPNANPPCSQNTQQVAWGDWDNNGTPDIAVANAGGGVLGCVQIISTNVVTAGFTFSTTWQSTQTNLDTRSVAWADYDGDGDLDLAVGVNGQFGQRNLVLRNENGQDLVTVWDAPTEDNDPTRIVAWGDYDSDGDPDLATGNALAPNKPNRIYINNWNGGTRLANDPTYVRVFKPGFTDKAWFFANHEIIGNDVIPVFFQLFDNQGDPAYEIIPQVSWDGGGTWEQMIDDAGDAVVLRNLGATPEGQLHFFLWGAMRQLLVRQGYTVDPDQDLYAPEDAPDQEMDVAYRFYVKASPEHGGYIQRPYFGTNTTMFRLDNRPDWSESAKLFNTERMTNVVVPGELANFSVVVTQTDHGIPPGLITDNLPPQLTLEVTPTVSPLLGSLEWTTKTIEWEGGLPYDTIFDLSFDARVARPLPNGSEITNCANLFDGLHEPFERCVTVVVSSTPKLDESFKLVNGVEANIAQPGERMGYTLVLTNTGTENATNMQMIDRLHPDLIFAGNLTYTGGTAELAGDTINWQGDINVFNPITITFDVTVTSPLPGNNVITNTFELLDNEGETVYTAVPVTTTVLAPDLRTSSKTVTPEEGLELGDTVTYQIVMTNTGAVAASPAILNDPLPGNSEYVAGSFTASSGTGDYNADTNQIEWQGTIARDEVVTLSFQVRAYPGDDGSDELVNVAALSDAVGGDVTLTATALFDLPDLGAASSKVAAQSIVELGDVVSYTIEVENRGGTAPLVTLDDPIPGSSTYVPGSFSASSGSGGFDPDNNRITWQKSLASDESATLNFAVTAGCPATPGTTLLTNTAVVNDGANDTTLQANTTLNLPNLFLSVDTSTRRPIDGEIVTYTLLLENGGGIAPNAAVLASIASNATIVGAPTASNGTVQYLPNTRQVRWSGELASSQNVEITFQAVVNGEPDSTVETFFTVNDTCSDQEAPSNVLTIRPDTVDVFLPLIAQMP